MTGGSAPERERNVAFEHKPEDTKQKSASQPTALHLSPQLCISSSANGQ